MTIGEQIKNYLDQEVFGGMTTLNRDRGNFENILNSKTSAAWGWNEPLKFNGWRIVYLQFSPACSGKIGSVHYDFITELGYRQKYC